jgi:hypothetical protein
MNLMINGCESSQLVKGLDTARFIMSKECLVPDDDIELKETFATRVDNTNRLIVKKQPCRQQAVCMDAMKQSSSKSAVESPPSGGQVVFCITKPSCGEEATVVPRRVHSASMKCNTMT